jgi:hypothetical protein
VTGQFTIKPYDVLIVGGGFAGVAAALESTRQGLRTALVEKTILWGGMCTSGLVPIYMPLCDGQGRQVSFGLAEELLRVSIKYGPGRVPPGWVEDESLTGSGSGAADEVLYDEGGFARRYQTFFAPPALALGLDEVLETCGADLWLDTLGCLPILEGRRVVGIEVENKSGRSALRGSVVIDATGDADIAFRAGAPCEARGSFTSILYQYTSLALAGDGVAKDTGRKLVTWKGGGAANELDKGYEGSSPKTMGTDARALTAWVMESRRLARQKLAQEQARSATGGGLGRENVYPAALPTMHQIRMTRMIVGQERVLAANMNKRCETSIGLAPDCRQANAVWEIPFGAILPQKVEGLLVIGRCSSAEGYAWQVTRLVPAVVLTGQVAALATALALKTGTLPDRLNVADVQRAAEAKGIVLHV